MQNLNEKITVRKNKRKGERENRIDTMEKLKFFKPKCQLINFEA